MSSVEPTPIDFQAFTENLGVWASLAGIGSAIASVLFWFYRKGIREGIKIENARRVRREIHEINERLNKE